ncbi:ubiquitin thioesterase ZRANB1-like [Pollicipes pollicipes]|uniref:ubiquitin thioesterase ZRANB1-like n=1 Tax=Pollicipes pollicipes TaxID=41117 RepID=UPI00188515E9|nr:ubiquitin thioesterase ZRANB1-like [Pollicipes pollicipes]
MSSAEHKWACEYCTYENFPSSKKCTMCYAPRVVYLISEQADPRGGGGGGGSSSPPASPRAADEAGRKWPCALCTYLNWPRAAKCVQCLSPRRRASPLSAAGLHEALAPLRIRTPSAESLARRGSPPTPSPRHQEPAAGPRKWACAACTYENYPRRRRCAASPPLSNYEYERRLKQLRRRQREADWGWLSACLATVDGDPEPVDAYLASGGDPARQLSKAEVTLLNRPAVFEPGLTLVHLAIRFCQDNILSTVLTRMEGSGSGVKRVPSFVAPDLAQAVRRSVATTLRQKKVAFPCYFMTDMTWFSLPADIEELPEMVQQQLFEELLDKDAQKELEVDAPIINWSLDVTERLGSRLHAVWNRTAGDCLLDSVLQTTWGVFDRENTLRRALFDSLHEAAGAFYPRWCEYERQQTERLQYSLDEDQLRHDWLQLLALGKPGMPLEQLHIWTLAHIIRRPIIVYGVKYVKSFRGEPLGYARFEGVYLPLLWDSSFCSKSPICLGYTRGHFSALLPAMPPTSHITGAGADQHSPEAGGVVFFPLMTHDGKLLPVHFVTRAERGREEALLRQWLDVCVTDGGCLVTQCQLPRPPLLVAQMVQEWLNYYRRMCPVTGPVFPTKLPAAGDEASSENESEGE